MTCSEPFRAASSAKFAASTASSTTSRRSRPEPSSGSSALVEEHRPVERVTLHRLEACIANDATQLFFSRTVGGARGLHHVLLEHHASHVIAAEAQPHLQHLEALRYPARLHVFDVFEIHARDGERLQILHRGRLVPTAAAQCCVLRLEAPRDKRCESAGLLLQLAN